MKRLSLWWLTGLVILSGLAGGALSSWLRHPPTVGAQPGTAPLSQVVTRDLQIVDANGTIRMRSTIFDGEAVVDLNDGGGRVMMVLGVRSNGVPTVELRDGTGTTRIRARVTADGFPFINVLDSQGNDRLYMGELNSGTPVFDVSDPSGTVIYRIPPPTP